MAIKMTAANQTPSSRANPREIAPLEAALEASGLGTWEWEATSDLLVWSRTLADIHGLDTRTLRGSIDALERSIDEGDRARVMSALRELLEGSGGCSVRYRVRPDDGAVRWIECTAVVARDRAGPTPRLAAICRDITDRVRLDHALNLLAYASEAFASSMDWDKTLQAVADSVIPELADWCAVDLVRNGQLSRVSVARSPGLDDGVGEALARELGIEQGASSKIREAIDSGAPRLVTEPSGSTVRSYLCVPLERRGVRLGAMTLASTDPARTYGRFEFDLVVQLARKAAAAIAYALEYTAAQEAVRVRDEVLAIVSHDLRNPLNTVHMAVTVLREELSAGTGSERLDVIDRAVKRAHNLIRDLLDVTCLGSGKIGIEPSPCSATRLLDDIEASFAPQAKIENKQLVVERPPSDGQVLADRQRILQVLSNLTSNAFRHARARVELGAARAGDQWTFWVHDDGPGLTAAQLPHVFEPFWQARKVRKGGAGLGLAIAHGLVQVHGGRIWVDTQVERGARFCFTLPVGTRA